MFFISFLFMFLVSEQPDTVRGASYACYNVSPILIPLNDDAIPEFVHRVSQISLCPYGCRKTWNKISFGAGCADKHLNFCHYFFDAMSAAENKSELLSDFKCLLCRRHLCNNFDFEMEGFLEVPKHVVELANNSTEFKATQSKELRAEKGKGEEQEIEGKEEEDVKKEDTPKHQEPVEDMPVEKEREEPVKHEDTEKTETTTTKKPPKSTTAVATTTTTAASTTTTAPPTTTTKARAANRKGSKTPSRTATRNETEVKPEESRKSHSDKLISEAHAFAYDPDEDVVVAPM